MKNIIKINNRIYKVMVSTKVDVFSFTSCSICDLFSYCKNNDDKSKLCFSMNPYNENYIFKDVTHKYVLKEYLK